MESILRKAVSKDLESLVNLFEEYRKFYRKKPDRNKAKGFLSDRLTKKDSVIYVVEAKGVLIGFTQLYPSFSSTKMQRLWVLNDLYIATDYRGLGYSKILIAAAKNHASESDACGLLLETEKDNIIGNTLYLKENFKLEQNNFYFWAV